MSLNGENTDSALISVIVPVYNVQAYLDRCLQSILNQDFPDFELILVDDGSVDRSKDICEKYSEKNANVSVYQRKKQGVASCRNFGLSVAQGDYITFVDADDYVSRDYLSSLLDTLRKYDADLVQCAYSDCDDGSVVDFRAQNSEVKSIEELARSTALKRCVNYQMDMVVWGKLYKASLFKGVNFPVGYTHEDTAVLPILISKCRKVVLNSRIIYAYVHRDTSIMGAKMSLKRLDIFHSYRILINYFEDTGDDEVRDIIRYHLFIDFCSFSRIFSDPTVDEMIDREVGASRKQIFFQILISRITLIQKIKALFMFTFPTVALRLIRQKRIYGMRI